ncbi:MAG: bifunctional tRNA (5-methylaminomethyl-2-thiouridine)(34)-methyltransferase MnmD/FAD-dependent 5-carboxymethylaminomethyl-2-thiouridine(34) oxidoreductase MnmC [Motiliproteus sp.]
MRSNPPAAASVLSGIEPLRWDTLGQPLSRRFNDFYFSRVNGLEETQYVYLRHNQLPQRWQSLAPGQAFCIGETGFGTGLNFLSCWQAWREHAAPTSRLHFISVERHPLSQQDLRRALSLWPQLAEFTDALVAQYPPPCGGFHRLVFDQGLVQLTLIFDDACHAIAQLEPRVDAWFLDGFSPAKNPEMWSPELFKGVARSSHRNTTFSTFSAASSVRRGLEAVGFAVNKAPGFGKKRELLYGQYRPELMSGSDQPRSDQPCSNQPWYAHPSLAADPASISIIGAGLAGASTAFALAERGCQVQLFERGAEPGCGASGNPQGVLYAKLPVAPTRSSRIHLNGYLYSLRLLQRQLSPGQHWSPCGVIQLALDDREADKQRKLLQSGQYPDSLVRPISAAAASVMAGYPLTAGGLLFPQGGWVSPAELCRKLLNHPNIHCHFNQPIDSIQFDPARQQWQLRSPSGALLHQAATLVVANAHEAGHFPALAELPLKPIRGQTTSVSTQSSALKTVLCGNGYIAPAKQQRYCFGASFDLNDLDTRVRTSDHRHNLALIEQMCPALAQQLAPQLAAAQGRVGFRCAAPDYLPIVGAVADPAAYIRDYAALRSNAKARIDTPPTHLPGLFVNLGHGSKGLITAPLAGALLADIMTHGPAPIEPELQRALNPARFIIKRLIKGII